MLRLGRVPLGDLLELRVLLESAALRQAAADPLPAGLETAREALTAMVEAQDRSDVEAYHQLDVAFHVALVGAAGNSAFDLVLEVLREAIAGHLRTALAALPHPRQVLERLTREHETILTAVARGHRAKAATLVRGHVLGFYGEHPSGDGPAGDSPPEAHRADDRARQ